MEGKYTIYTPVARAGLGHCLTAITAYANYSSMTGREYLVNTKHWTSFLQDPSSDIDPFFKTYFDEKSFEGNGIDLSNSRVKSVYDQAGNESWETLVLVDKTSDIEQFRKVRLGAEIQGDVRFMLFSKFRKKYFLKQKDHPAKLIVIMVNEPTKGGRELKKVRDFNSAGSFNPDYSYPDLGNIDLGKCVGIHLRHGNGEYLHGRLEGDDIKFERYVDRVVRKAQKLAKNENLDIIAFSDSNKLLARLKKKHGILIIKNENLPDKAWFDHLKSKQKEDKPQVIEKVMQDFYAIANCKHVVCGLSLFTMAAYFFSKHRSFHLMSQKWRLFRFL